MGLELSEDVIRENMPEYLVVPQAPVSLLFCFVFLLNWIVSRMIVRSIRRTTGSNNRVGNYQSMVVFIFHKLKLGIVAV